jgi:DNA polymerase-3 subunit alpha
VRNFTHLHVHSEFTLLRAASRLDDLIQRCLDHQMPALALTDGGNLFASIPFHQKARAAGLQPILGLETRLAPTGRLDRGRQARRSYPLVLLAADVTGWQNLLQLATIGYLEGHYYHPRVDLEVLSRHHEGLIGLSGSLPGIVGDRLALDDDQRARRWAGDLAAVFDPGSFYLELQDHGLPQETKVNEKSIALGQEMGLPCVATNNVYYTRREDHVAHDVLLCIGQGKLRADERRPRFNDQYYLKTPEEMAHLFGHWPQVLDATEEIRERCQLEITLGEMHIPAFTPPEDKTPEVYLRELCETGLEERYPTPQAPEVRERLEMELGVIQRMGFTCYFLIVWDFIEHARRIGVPVGPGRGSGAGSIVAYSLGITALDPLHYGLLFERFLNEGRVEMPDIDIDFETEGRARIIDYVTSRYGRENVAQIITFGTLGARQALRDTARVLDIPLATVDMIAKKVPMDLSLERALAADPDLRELVDGDEQLQELFDIASRIEGLARHAGTHAGGVIIADQPLVTYCPLFRHDEDIATQFDMRICEQIGLLKMDMLGLSTLTLIQRAEQIIQESRDLTVDVNDVPRDDPRAYELLARGESKGVFQLESSGMRQLLVKMCPDRFEDLIALVALYRPGPLQSGMVDNYIDVKHGREQPTYLHPGLEPALRETYGVILYQEQVMRIASDLAGFTLQEADRLRKAMGKKKKALMATYRERFREGAEARGVPPELASQIFEHIAHFAGYGFNKSHSTAYALVAYQTAYLKAVYPVEFMAALLSVEALNTDKVVEYCEECRRLGITLLPPDINHSAAHFSVVPASDAGEGGPDRHIRFGLAAIKGIGTRAIESVVACREEHPFRGLLDFAERVDLRQVNRGALEALIKAGAFDSVESNRARLLAGLDRALAVGGRAQTDRRRGQGALFAAAPAEASPDADLPPVPAWSEKERLAAERESLGFFLSGHPLDELREGLQLYSTATTRSLEEVADGAEVRLGGMITGVTARVVQKAGRNQGRRWARFLLEDLVGSITCVCFPDQFERARELLTEDRIVFVRGNKSVRGVESEILVEEVVPIEEAASLWTTQVLLDVQEDLLADERGLLEQLAAACRSHTGLIPVVVRLPARSGEATVSLKIEQRNWVQPGPDFVGAMEQLLGEGHVHLLAH